MLTMDIVFFAIIALFLVWKLKNVLNSDQTFVMPKSDNERNDNFQNIKEKVSIRNVEVISVKDKKEDENFFENEKVKIHESLHNSYKSILEVYPGTTIDNFTDIIYEIYEDLIFAFEKKVFDFQNFSINPDLLKQLQKNVEKLPYSICLSNVVSVEIKDLEMKNKIIRLVASISSQQIIYKTDAEGNVVEGSKTVPVTVNEEIEIIRNNIWILESIKSIG